MYEENELTPNFILSNVNTHSIEGFSFAIKSHLLDMYEIKCVIQYFYVCRHQR